MKTRKTIGQLFLALVLVSGFTACNKKDSDEMPPPVNDVTAVRLVFVDSTINQRAADSKIDLTQASEVKIKYMVNDEKEINEATLLLSGDSTKVSTSDMKALAFKGGTKLTISDATVYSKEQKILGSWSRKESDVFEVSSPEGVAFIDRTYGSVGIEKF